MDALLITIITLSIIFTLLFHLFVYLTHGTDGGNGMGYGLLFNKKNRFLFKELRKRIKNGDFASIDLRSESINFSDKFSIELHGFVGASYYKVNGERKSNLSFIENVYYMNVLRKHKKKKIKTAIDDVIAAATKYENL